VFWEFGPSGNDEFVDCLQGRIFLGGLESTEKIETALEEG